MFEESEIVQLVMGLGMLPILWLARVPRGRLGFGLCYAGAAAMLASWVLTVVEGVVAPVLCNLVEHALHAVAGLLLLAACWTWSRSDAAGEEPQP